MISFKKYIFWPVKNRFIHCCKFLAFKYFVGFLTPLGDESRWYHFFKRKNNICRSLLATAHAPTEIRLLNIQAKIEIIVWPQKTAKMVSLGIYIFYLLIFFLVCTVLWGTSISDVNERGMFCFDLPLCLVIFFAIQKSFQEKLSCYAMFCMGFFQNIYFLNDIIFLKEKIIFADLC
jgi:hypothetical protein